MKSNSSLTWTFLIAGVVGIACLSLVLFVWHLNVPDQIASAQQIPAESIPIPKNVIETVSVPSPAPQVQSSAVIKKTIPTNLPVRIKIPRIRVSAKIESVGLTKDGAVGVPKGPSNAAWFNVSPRPGEKGSSVITGHYGYWKGGASTVFNFIDRLKKGDKIFVEDGKGVVTTFVVREMKSYDPTANAIDVFGDKDGKSHLNLITCEGVWNAVLKSFPKRLVVFADKI